MTYKQTAKELNVHYLFGRWGFTFSSSLPGGGKSYRLRLVPLDGWITDPKEVERHFRENGFEL
jgi:hypothetical protein